MAAEKHILVGLPDGLHAISLLTGNELWHFTDPDGKLGGKTPAVDQTNKFIYFQTDFRLHKIDARNGKRLDFVASLGRAFSGNTVLVNDAHGYHILCFWYRWQAYGSMIQCFDVNLDLEWEVTGLSSTFKNGICYHDGLVYVGTGEVYGQGQQLWYTGELEDCRVNAYAIANGSLEWTKLLSDPVDKIFESGGYAVMNMVYCNGYLILDQDASIDSCPARVRVLNALTGELLKTYEGENWSSSCAGVSLSYGRLVSGDLNSKKAIVYQIGTGAKTDFAPFGVHQTNTMEADDTALATLDENITKIGEITGGDQGSVVYDGVAFVAYGTANQGIVSFDIETLATIRQFATANSYDASPLVVQSSLGDDYILIHENETERVICRKVDDGSLVWYATGLPSNAIFGLTYYVSDTASVIGGMTSAEILTAINDNFTTLNALIADAATIIVITSAVQWDDINANIASLNTEGVAVSATTIEEGMTGTQFNDIINNFVTDYNAVN